jgi:hypothetical protein
MALTWQRILFIELQVLVCECARSEVAQITDSLRCVSEGVEHSGVNFPGFAVLTKALLNGTGLPALRTAKLLAKFLGCTDVVSVHLFLTLVGCSIRILPLVVLEVVKCLVVYKRDRAMQTTFSFLSRWPNRRAVGDELELELELIQTHMAQKPLLWVEVGAHAVRNRLKCGGVGWAGAGVAWRLCVCCL